MTTTWLAIAVLATARSSAAQSTAAAITGVGTLLSGSGSSAGRGLALGVLLASPHLAAAAQPFGPANASVATTRRKLGYVMTDSTIRTAVAAWLSDRAAAEATYGHISRWATGGVTDMSELFCASDGCDYYNSAAASFNEDIGAWDTSGVANCVEISPRHRAGVASMERAVKF